MATLFFAKAAVAGNPDADITAGAAYFVTGDRRDFGHLYEQEVLGEATITPLRMSEMVLESE